MKPSTFLPLLVAGLASAAASKPKDHGRAPNAPMYPKNPGPEYEETIKVHQLYVEMEKEKNVMDTVRFELHDSAGYFLSSCGNVKPVTPVESEKSGAFIPCYYKEYSFMVEQENDDKHLGYVLHVKHDVTDAFSIEGETQMIIDCDTFKPDPSKLSCRNRGDVDYSITAKKGGN